MYMQTGSKGRLIASAGVAALATLGLWLAPLAASADHKPNHNPGGGGGGGGDCGSGTMYFVGQQLWSMSCDGSNKTALAADVGWSNDPSRALHGPDSNRWFLRASNGDLFAVRDVDGFEAQLTDVSSGVAAGSAARWSKDDPATSAVDEADSFIAFVGTDGSGVEGIYTAAVAFDADGIPSAGDVQLTLAVVGVVVFDLSPDAGAIVYVSSSWELIVADLAGGSSLIATGTDAGAPSWAPDGSAIAFTIQNVGVATIRPDGSNLKILVRRKPRATPFFPDFSPTGSHILYGYFDRSGSDSPIGSLEIYRMTAEGRGKVNLTEDITELVNPVGWR